MSLGRVIETLAHRGPDASAIRDFHACALAHTRLRIIDLSEAADQPLANEDGTVWVVFNGEIYNFSELRAELMAAGHRFRTRADTEVLVHLYERDGDAMVQRLEGIFAFAIWDDRRGRLLLVRDRLGVKPLYYAAIGGGLRFASQVRALLDTRSRLDCAALAGYLRTGWVSAPATIVEGVSELLPGHVLEWTGCAGYRVRRWWSPPPLARPVPRVDDPLPDALRAALTRQLVAEVPVGLFLSGGLDSRVLAHLAAFYAPSLRTYTVGFDVGVDETTEAAAEARRLGLEHTVVRVGGAEILSSLEDIVADMDQPTVDGVNTWVISRAVRRAGLVVALSGLGGDELFAGYSTFSRVPRLARAGALARCAPLSWRRAVASAALRGRSHQLRRAADAVGGSEPWADAYLAMRGITTTLEWEALWAGSPPADNAVSVVAGRHELDTVTRTELANYLPNQLLRDTDCMSMAHALEVRVPLLDEYVVDAALRVPMDAQRRTGKMRLASAVAPDLVVRAGAPKKTFTLPFELWLRGPLANRAREAMHHLATPDSGVAPAALDDVWSRWWHGRGHWRTVWGLAVAGLWIEKHLSG